MDTVKLLGLIAGIFSTIALLGCGIFAPIISNEITSIREEVDQDMAEFKVLSDIVWKEMIEITGGVRFRRQNGYVPPGGSASPTPLSPSITPPAPAPFTGSEWYHRSPVHPFTC